MQSTRSSNNKLQYHLTHDCIRRDAGSEEDGCPAPNYVSITEYVQFTPISAQGAGSDAASAALAHKMHASFEPAAASSQPSFLVSAADKTRLNYSVLTPNETFNPSVLPVLQVEQEIRANMRESTTVLVMAETGTGKTVTLPGMLYLEMCLLPYSQPSGFVFLVIPTVTAVLETTTRLQCLYGADFVCSRDRFPDDTGAQKRGDPATAKIHVLTSSMMLHILAGNPMLTDCVGVIVDEVHEDTNDINMLLTELGDLRRKHTDRAMMRLIVCSATMDWVPVADFLHRQLAPKDSSIVSKPPPVVPVLHLEQRQSHDVKIFRSLVDLPPDKDTLLDTAVTLIKHTRSESVDGRQGVIVIVPGKEDVEKLIKKLAEDDYLETANMLLMPYHSELQAKDMAINEVVLKPNQMQVILATSVGRTSITPKHVCVVIDLCRSKLSWYDQATDTVGLQCEWASKDEVKQGAGRVGRVGSGVVYQLITNDRFSTLHQHKTSESVRSDWTAPCVLMLCIEKTWASVCNVVYFRGPTLVQLQSAREKLFSFQAVDCNGDLTKHGNWFARLPLEPMLSHVLLRGLTKPWRYDLASICAMCSCKIVLPRKGSLSRFKEFDSIRGDLFSLLEVFKKFVTKSEPDQLQMCTKYDLNAKQMYLAVNLQRQLIGRVEKDGYVCDKNETYSRVDLHRHLIDSLARNIAYSVPQQLHWFSLYERQGGRTVRMSDECVLFVHKKTSHVESVSRRMFYYPSSRSEFMCNVISCEVEKDPAKL